jgi:uncharacterized membrane protein YczE
MGYAEVTSMFSRILRVLLVLFGTWLTSVGILFFIESGYGADPISTFLLGVINFAPISVGRASQIFNLSILTVMFFVDRRFLGIGSLLNAFFVGFFMNVFAPAMACISVYIPVAVQILLGPVLLGFGTGLYLSAKLGSGALESLMLYISEKLKISIKFSRMALDGTLVLSGIVLGGAWGVGSILGIALIGPIAGGTLKLAEMLVGRNSNKNL